jgi:hypothetical protein
MSYNGYMGGIKMNSNITPKFSKEGDTIVCKGYFKIGDILEIESIGSSEVVDINVSGGMKVLPGKYTYGTVDIPDDDNDMAFNRYYILYHENMTLDKVADFIRTNAMKTVLSRDGILCNADEEDMPEGYWNVVFILDPSDSSKKICFQSEPEYISMYTLQDKNGDVNTVILGGYMEDDEYDIDD